MWWRSEATVWLVAIAVMVILSISVVALRPRFIAAATAATVTATGRPPTPPPPFREDAANLLANPSFRSESATPGVADGWVRTDDQAEYALEARTQYGGRSQRIRKTATLDPLNHYSALQQTVTAVAGGGSYIVSIDYMYAFESATDASRSVGIVVYCLDSERHFIDDGTALDWGWPQTAQWTRRSLTFRTPSRTEAVVVQFRISVNGSFWIDGAQLTRVGASSRERTESLS